MPISHGRIIIPHYQQTFQPVLIVQYHWLANWHWIPPYLPNTVKSWQIRNIAALLREFKILSVMQAAITFHTMPSVKTRLQLQCTSYMIVRSCHQARNQPSLNDCLLTGQSQLDDLCCIILRFRLHPVGICMDIEKAFLHIQLHKDDRDHARFFWSSDPQNPDSEFVTFRFRVVLFCTPFMLNAALHCHLAQYNSPTAKKMIANLYVDNVVSGCPSEFEAISYYNEAPQWVTPTLTFEAGPPTVLDWWTKPTEIRLLMPTILSMS